ncbi:hypothetical protein CSA56_18385 [candidate division KSB3 bacterium]|uniref:Uncharacterized protein n=1 Tax=candidate division KSB3 bacterium TaxID=2044937 RepID=A0A2G6K6U9_9BACT|nr:MAG: hypothetical protein CSA56_18385 [candidate division KSB3 bacterium]
MQACVEVTTNNDFELSASDTMDSCLRGNDSGLTRNIDVIFAKAGLHTDAIHPFKPATYTDWYMSRRKPLHTFHKREQLLRI